MRTKKAEKKRFYKDILIDKVALHENYNKKKPIMRLFLSWWSWSIMGFG
jgi:hypothetical protein